MRESENGPVMRAQLGDAAVTIVSDGSVAFPVDFFYAEAPAEERAALRAAFGQAPDTHRMAANVMVLDLDGRRILIDAGGGGKFQPSGGALPESLQAAGIAPESIDLVVFTHLHPDHLWGVTDADNAAPAFPEAGCIAPETELAFWRQDGLAERMPNEFAAWIARETRAHLDRIADRMHPVAPGDAIIDGLRYRPSPGHTPGHAAIVIVRGDETLVVTGDVLTDPVAAFARPDWPLGVDADAEQGAATRRELLESLAAARARIFANHLPGGGLGHVAKVDGGYRWVPADWAV